MEKKFNSLLQKLDDCFLNEDYRISHERAHTVMAELANDPGILHWIVIANLKRDGFFSQSRINPVLSLPVRSTAGYTLVAHLWLPLDNYDGWLSHQSVHHHGNLLLTSASAWGSGYRSVLFKPGFTIEGGSRITDMKIEKVYKNPKGLIEFIGARTPHVVFFPTDFTVTYALWSGEKKRSGTGLARSAWIQKHKGTIKSLLSRAGLASSLGINVVENLDFYPRDGKLISMKDRVTYQPGSVPNFIQNFFFALQSMKFAQFDELKKAIQSADAAHGSSASRWFDQLELGTSISPQMDPRHKDLARAQFSFAELAACFSEMPEEKGLSEDLRNKFRIKKACFWANIS